MDMGVAGSLAKTLPATRGLWFGIHHLLKRLAEIFAVLVLTAGLMAGGAALYSWLRPQAADGLQGGSEQVTGLTPQLTEPIVFALIQNFLETPSQDFLANTTIDQRNNLESCFQKGAKGVRYRAGAWTIHLAGIGCKGLEVFTVDDLTGQVIALAPALTAFTFLTPTPVAPTHESTPTLEPTSNPGSTDNLEPTSNPGPTANLEPTPNFEPTPNLESTPNLEPTPAPGSTPTPRPTPSPEFAKVIRLIEKYLADSGELNVICITNAVIEGRKGFLPSAATTGIYWTVKAENDAAAQSTWGCPRFHFYEIDDFTGKVRRTPGK